MSKTVYAVSSGSYSDYGVRSLYTTREAAQAHVDRFNSGQHYDDAFVEEFELHSKLIPIVQVYRFSGQVNPAGVRHNEREWDYADDSGAKHPVQVTVSDDRFGTKYVFAEGADRAKVQKAYQDRMAQTMAEVMGL